MVSCKQLIYFDSVCVEDPVVERIEHAMHLTGNETVPAVSDTISL